MILQNLKATAESYLGTKVTDAVITVPPTLTMPSVRPRRTPAGSPALTSAGSSTNRQRRPLPTASIKLTRK